MRVVALHRHGGPEVLELEDWPTPEPGPGQVLVRVEAVALNHLDLFVRQGLPNLKLEYPHVLPFEQFRIAHELLEERKQFGKIVLALV